MAGTFAEFLSRNSIVPAKRMPLVHSTAAYHLKSIAQENAIIPRPCDVFKGEDLSYFFVGRPAYKYGREESDAQEWQLPCCFIFAFDSIRSTKRIFPFDSGGFSRGLYPDHISMMNRDEFDVGTVADAPEKIVGAYFGDIQSYLMLRPKSRIEFEREFSLGVLDAEIKALHRLATSEGERGADDRRLSIEVQSASVLDMTVNKPLAVILPAPYYEEKSIRDHVENAWGAVPISYPMSSLSVKMYFALIYDRVASFYKNELGII